jgi:MFS family permease
MRARAAPASGHVPRRRTLRERAVTAAEAAPLEVGASVAPEQKRRDLHAILGDGICFSVMVGLGESFIAAFALAAGLGEIVAGLVSTVPMLTGACLQLITPKAVRYLGSYRRWVVLCARLQAASFLPLVTACLVGEVRLLWVGVASVAYWTFGMSTSPAWNAWVTSLVPKELRATYFARRARSCHAALLAALLVGGAVLELRSGAEEELLAFALLFAGACVARLVSAAYLSRQSELPGLAASHPVFQPVEVWGRLHASGAARVLAYLLAMQVATYTAAPYFTPYMLGPLELSYTEFAWLTAVAFLARIGTLPLLGRLAQRTGIRELLWLGAIGIVPLPMLWLVSNDFLYLLAIQLVAGTAWGALELGTSLAFFERIEDRDRAGVLSVFNFLNAIALTVGSLVGASLFLFADAATAYYATFVISTVGRGLALPLLGRVSVGAMPFATFIFRTLAVRPSGVAIQRPILSTLERPSALERQSPGEATARGTPKKSGTGAVRERPVAVRAGPSEDPEP